MWQDDIAFEDRVMVYETMVPNPTQFNKRPTTAVGTTNEEHLSVMETAHISYISSWCNPDAPGD
jgi:hypothetical protein